MRMNRIILASHGGLSAGMKDTVQMILGEMPNLYALATLPEYPAVHLICGMNASLVLTLASNDEALTQDELAECIADAKAQIIDCNLLLKNAAQDEEDDL